MTRRTLIPLAALTLLAAGWPAGLAQDSKTKDPESRYAVDLRVRKAGEAEFTRDTKCYAVEVYTDGNTGDALHLSETGALAVVPAKQFRPGDGKGPLWQHGLTLRARPAGEKDWDRSKKFGIEVFRDENNGDLLCITENGAVAAVGSRYAVATDKGKPKNPKWKHAMDLRVRKAGEKDWDRSKKFGIEVFRDENNGNLIYIVETGAIAVVPSRLASKDDTGKGPIWQHGLELRVRKAGEKDWDRSKKFGIEVFLDENNGNLIYIVETGAIAVVPGKFVRATEGKSKDPELKHAIDLSVRKVGQKEFSKDDRKFGVEIYADENNGNVLYVSETGDLAAVSPRSE